MWRSERREWKGEDMERGEKVIRKEEEMAWRIMNCEGERRRA